MTTSDAVEVCKQWFVYLDGQRARADEMLRLATLARTGPEGTVTARRKMHQIQTKGLVVFDGAKLEPAVRHLVEEVTKGERNYTDWWGKV